jgi:hypothetical protein
VKIRKRGESTGYWFHLSAVDFPCREDFARGSATGGGLTAISPCDRRAEKLLPNLCIRLKSLFIALAYEFEPVAAGSPGRSFELADVGQYHKQERS